MNRQATVSSLECRGVLAYWINGWKNSSLPVHSGCACHASGARPEALGLPEHKIRVIAPDVGGGFGGKNRLLPEEIAVAAIALKVGASRALDRGSP